MPSNDWIKRREEIEKLENKIDILEGNILDLQKQLIESYKRIKELSDKGTIQWVRTCGIKKEILYLET